MTHPMRPVRSTIVLLLGLLVALLAACGSGAPADPADPDPGADAGVDAAVDRCASEPAGTLGCECLGNGACGGDLRCVAGTCQPCPPGEEGCGCTGGVLCQGELVCSGGVCVPDRCVDGALDCACREAGAEARCDPGTYCAGTGTCAACASDVVGCPCDGDRCGGGLVCGDDSLCRLGLACADLRAAGQCGAHQVCQEAETAGSDARCVAEACELGYHWSAEVAGCAPDATCVAGAPGSIVGDCRAENRTCVELDGEDACGECLPGTELVDGDCRAQIDCGGAVCGADQYCDRLAAGGPTCQAWPCPRPDQVVDTLGLCAVTCTRSCDFEGSTGRYWPFADNEDSCVCETRPGYFWLKGQDSKPEACDADLDGWVRDEVRSDLITGPAPIPALAQNMRCDIRSVDRVALQSEDGLRAEVRSCEQGLVESGGACDVVPLRLLESERNDVPLQLAMASDAPPHGDAGSRRLRAKELNALTKACVSSTGDFNDDGVEDIDEVQDTDLDTSGLGEAARLASFGYFVELNGSWYERDGGARHGRLVIAERSRCDGDLFALGYDELTSYDPEQASSYWRSCTRRRDPSFDADRERAGNDFAQWDCDARHGSCPVTPPPHPTIDASAGLDPDDVLLRQHGLCELGGVPPADGIWRGMNHHSQFKCVAVIPQDPGLPRRWATPSEFDASGTLVMNDCRARTCDGVADCEESRRTDELDASQPLFQCEARRGGARPQPGEVGWAAVRYQPYGHVDDTGARDSAQYAGSCVNEDAEWLFAETSSSAEPREYLCPYPEYGRLADAATDAFGRYRCYGWDAFFLWAGPEETAESYDRPSLVWADASGELPANASMWR
jgi:hypothetical protein